MNTKPVKRTNALVTAASLSLLMALPLVGTKLAGKPLQEYAEFPPLTQHVAHAGFSWPVFVVMAALILAVVLPFDLRVIRTQRAMAPAPRPPARRFPWWGWIGLFAGLASWTLAWTRFPWFAPLQSFTFSPLWFSYICVINALTYRRTGHCLIADRPRHLLRLFLASAVFWWFFEYLNRFVQNWHYVGVDGLSGLQYVVFATLPFSTVLPAVLSTHELLASFPWAGVGLERFAPVRPGRPRVVAAAALALAAAGLAGIGLWPDYLFPLLWVSPLVVITSLQALVCLPTIFTPVRSGDWRRVYLLAMSALICGFFWEMWNYASLARWAYTVPFVGRFRLFEMPLLGYAGYLPFGLECAVIADWLAPMTGVRRQRAETGGAGNAPSHHP